MSDNRRENERIQILGQLPGDATVRQAIYVTQLSRNGAQIETTFPLQINSLHEFRLELGSQSVIVKGRVVHCHIHDVDPDALIYVAGVEFIDMAIWVADALEQFLEAVKTGRHG